MKFEGNTLTELQISAIIDEKHVVGPEKYILEVLNTIKVYHQHPKVGFLKSPEDPIFLFLRKNFSNMGLFKKRAKAVKDYLVSKGMNANRLKTNDYGEKHPVETNSRASGKKKNRRTEVVFE